MRLIPSAILGIVCVTGLAADPGKDEPAKRYGIAADLKTYPQDAPKEALASVIKAAQDKRFDYLVAQLADPAYIDNRIKTDFGGKFEEQVGDVRTKLDAPHVQLLERFLKDGNWGASDSTATVTLKDVKDRSVSFVKVGDRWFLKNDDKR